MEKAVFIGTDPQVAELVRLSIRLHWPTVTPLVATRGKDGLELVKRESPDLVLIRPDFSDKPLAELIRDLRHFATVPLIVLSHQGRDLEGFTALEAGADEYVQLPCDLSELTFKILSLMRRTEMEAYDPKGSPLLVGELKILPATHEVFLGGKKLELTPVEFKLAHLLIRNCGHVVSRSTIERELSIVGLGKVGSAKQHVMRLRRKLGDNAQNPRWIATVPGVGYRFIGPAPM